MLRICSLLVLLAGAPAAAETVTGPIRVVDGDTFDVRGTRIRLFGIDAPEGEQTCRTAEGREWPCGSWSTEQVRSAYQGRRAVCDRVNTDQYGRMVARCTVEGADMAQRIVAEGWAFAYQAYSSDYIDAEKRAAVAGLGVWQGRAERPDAWRRARAAAVPDATPPGGACVIKGNISSSGKIYHLPGQENYAETRINPSRGERWFCSEAEARSAGWRRARR